MKRCNCNSGECINCLLDNIDEDIDKLPDFRHCLCESEHCFICSYYKQVTNVKRVAAKIRELGNK